MATHPAPVRHRDGTVTLKGKVIGTIERRVEPTGPTRRNGTRRHHVTWNVVYVDRTWLGKVYRRADAMTRIADYARARAIRPEVA